MKKIVHTEIIKYGIEPDPKFSKYIRDNQHEIFTFDTGYTGEKLKHIRKRLIRAKFIDRNITEDQFSAIFKKQMLTWRIKPIVWLDSKENLRFFLETLIPGITIHKFQVAACFVDPSGKPIQINKPNRTKENEFIFYGRKKILSEIIYSL